MHKDYMGDGVYVERDDATWDIILTTENGVEVTNRIVLEHGLLDGINKWVKRTETP